MTFHLKDALVESEPNLQSCPTTTQPLSLVVFAASVYLILWVAIANGYPVVFYDTAGYVLNSVTLSATPFRPITYGLFIRFVSFGITPWLVLLAQSVITVLLLSMVFEYLAEHRGSATRKANVFLGLVIILALTTSLPWFVALIMPDVFTAVLFLSFFLLVYEPELSRGEILFLCCVFAISVGSHLSHLPIIAGLLLLLLVIYPLKALRRWRPCRSLQKTLALLITPIFLSVTVIALLNWDAGMGFAVSPAGHAFLMGRLLASGLAQDYLKQNCANEELASCKYLDNLPAGSQEFLLQGHPLLKEMGGWLGSQKEADEIIIGTIKHHPIRFLVESGRQMLRQFISFSPRDTSDRDAARFPMNVDTFRNLFPGDFPKYERSQQSVGRLEKLVLKLESLQKITFWCALLISLLLVSLKQYRAGPATQLLVPALIFMFTNALATGALSGVSNRYQARVSWLVVLCCFGYFVPILLKNTRFSDALPAFAASNKRLRAAAQE